MTVLCKEMEAVFTCLWVKVELQKKQLMWSRGGNVSRDVDARAERLQQSVTVLHDLCCKPSLMEEEAVWASSERSPRVWPKSRREWLLKASETSHSSNVVFIGRSGFPDSTIKNPQRSDEQMNHRLIYSRQTNLSSPSRHRQESFTQVTTKK